MNPSRHLVLEQHVTKVHFQVFCVQRHCLCIILYTRSINVTVIFVLEYAGVFWLRVDSKSRFPVLAVSAASVIPVAIPNPAIRFWGFQGCY